MCKGGMRVEGRGGWHGFEEQHVLPKSRSRKDFTFLLLPTLFPSTKADARTLGDLAADSVEWKF